MTIGVTLVTSNVTFDASGRVVKRERKILGKYLKLLYNYCLQKSSSTLLFKIKLQSSPSKGNTRCSWEYINEILQYSYWKAREKSWQPDNRKCSFKERNGGFEISNAVSFWYNWRKDSWSWRKGITSLKISLMIIKTYMWRLDI